MLLRHIRYLKAVVDHGSFTRAAQALHVSQPALSQQIRELELGLGARLLDRSGRQVRPTDLGVAYLRHVDRALKELDEATRAVRDVEDLSTGSLRLGITPSIAAYLIAPLLRHFRSTYPEIGLVVRVSAQEEIEPALRNDELDLGIGFGDLPAEDIETIPLHDERLALIVSATWQGTRGNAFPAAELASTPLALLDGSFSTRRLVDQYFQNSGLRSSVAVEVNSITALMEIVRQTDLATILPANVAGAGLATIGLPPEFAPRRAALLRRRNAYHSAAARAFVVATKEVTSAMDCK